MLLFPRMNRLQLMLCKSVIRMLLVYRKGEVEYRSASRKAGPDGKVNRKRVKAIRLALQKKGWRSSGI
jgi:uncharacterized protein (DUF1499 family)